MARGVSTVPGPSSGRSIRSETGTRQNLGNVAGEGPKEERGEIPTTNGHRNVGVPKCSQIGTCYECWLGREL